MFSQSLRISPLSGKEMRCKNLNGKTTFHCHFSLKYLFLCSWVKPPVEETKIEILWCKYVRLLMKWNQCGIFEQKICKFLVQKYSCTIFPKVIYISSLCSYMPERARSRSPLSRSLSPHSHSPSFTSCSSAHSPQGAPCRGQERGSNGLAPCRGSWDWSPHLRRSEDERERDDPWRNGGSVDDDRPNGRVADRRKAYQKPLDHISSRSADERGGGGGEGIRGNRDWHARGSPQGVSFNSYRNMEEDFYIKEQMYKSDKLPRPPYQRHDTKPKRRDGGEYHGRLRHYEFEMTEEPLRRTPEEKRQTSPGRGRSEKTSKRHTTAEKHERDKVTENTVSNFGNLTTLLYTWFMWHILLINEFILFLGSPVKRQIWFTPKMQ